MDETTKKLRPHQPGWWLQRPVIAYRRLVSPVLGRRCIYLPTCSEYALDAIGEWGAVRGSWLTMKRIGRCNPLREGGFDPVPRRSATPSNLEAEAH